MKLNAAALVLGAALGASAHPNGHAHRFLHRRAIDSSSRFFMSTRPDPPVDKAAKGSDPAPAPAPDSVPKPTYPAPEVPASPGGDIPPSTDPSKPGPGGFDWSRDNGQGVGIEEPFCKGMSKRATAAQNAYPGFTGPPGQFGCNLKLIRASVVEKYPYTLTINNVVDKDQQCVCWNKVGKEGELNGFWKGKEVFKFDLGSQKSQSVAVHPVSIGGCSCDVGQLPQTTSFGQWAGTWVEFDFVSDVNKGHSGADASCLAAASEKLNIPGMKVYRIDGTEKPSVICPGGSGTNAYVDGTKYADGIGLNLQNSTTIRVVADVGHKC